MKWLFFEFEILILDELMCGIDVGVKYEIYIIICDLVVLGKFIIVILFEMFEFLGIIDWIIVMNEGCLVGEMFMVDVM